LLVLFDVSLPQYRPRCILPSFPRGVVPFSLVRANSHCFSLPASTEIFTSSYISSDHFWFVSSLSRGVVIDVRPPPNPHSCLLPPHLWRPLSSLVDLSLST